MQAMYLLREYNRWRETMELDLKDYLKIIRKRLWLILAIVVISCVATGLVSYLMLTPQYQASTKLIVNKPNESAGVNALNINDVNLNIKIIDTYKEVIKTTHIMEMVANENPQFQMTAEQLIGKVTVSSVNNTQVMTLAVQDPSYEKAVSIVNAVSHIFQREISNIMKVDNVSILTEAKLSPVPAPISPKPKLNLALSFIVSLMAAMGLAFLLEYLDDTVKSEADIEQLLGIPTLTMISKIKPEDLQYEKTSVNKNLGEGAAQHANATINH